MGLGLAHSVPPTHPAVRLEPRSPGQWQPHVPQLPQLQSRTGSAHYRPPSPRPSKVLRAITITQRAQGLRSGPRGPQVGRGIYVTCLVIIIIAGKFYAPSCPPLPGSCPLAAASPPPGAQSPGHERPHIQVLAVGEDPATAREVTGQQLPSGSSPVGQNRQMEEDPLALLCQTGLPPLSPTLSPSLRPT